MISENHPQLFAQAVRYHQAGTLDEAERLYRQIVQADPHHADALHFLGVLAQQTGRNEEATDLITKAIACNVHVPSFYNNLGISLREQGELVAAATAYGRALALKPDHAEVHYNLGVTLKEQGLFEETAQACRRALVLKPDHAKAYTNLGNVLQEVGDVTSQILCYRRALAIKPDLVDAENNLIFAQLYRPGVGLAEILADAQGWNGRHAASFQDRWPVGARPGFADRLPRIGFISADFRSHPVGFLTLPAIEGLAHAGFPITCYSNSGKSDDVTARFTRAATRWRIVDKVADEALADLIQADAIDILVDLSGYSAGNRLLALARKPAPLQIACWVGYPATSGMAAMDYVLADRWQIPVGAEAFYSEAVARLPHSYIAFEPPAGAPPVSDLPAVSQGGVTFGSFNALKKITPETVAVWGRILAKVPASRLLLKSPALGDPTVQRRYARLFADQGVAEERLMFFGETPRARHLELIGRTDIALDSFPYSGGQTTLECLWMGGPVVALPGETFASRHSLGYLSNVGLGDLAASSVDQYLDRAVALANDLARLSVLRAGMRDRLLSSPLCDVESFTGDLASALMEMWRRWCGGQPAGAFNVSELAPGRTEPLLRG